MGRLKVQCFRGNDYIPIDGAKITVKGSAGSENLKSIELSYRFSWINKGNRIRSTTNRIFFR